MYVIRSTENALCELISYSELLPFRVQSTTRRCKMKKKQTGLSRKFFYRLSAYILGYIYVRSLTPVNHIVWFQRIKVNRFFFDCAIETNTIHVQFPCDDEDRIFFYTWRFGWVLCIFKFNFWRKKHGIKCDQNITIPFARILSSKSNIILIN